MSELEWCLEHFNENFSRLAGEKIALYGEVKIAEQIKSKCPQFKLVSLADDGVAGKFIKGRYMMGLDELYASDISYLILLPSQQDLLERYERIRNECMLNYVCVLDLYGKQIETYYRKKKSANANYSMLKETDLYAEIDRNDVIAFSTGDTLFAQRNLYFSDFYKNIEKQLNEKRLNVFDFMQSVANIKKRDSFSNLRVIIEVLIKERCWPDEYLEAIWAVVLEEVKKAFVPRRAMVEAFLYAREKGKKVFVVDDLQEYRLPGIVWRTLLEAQGMHNCDEVICGGELWQHKEEGLFRTVLEKMEPGMSCLYIGSDLQTDVILPMRYGINTFWVKSPMELFRDLDGLALEQLENKTVRSMFQKYLMEVYCPSYVVSAVYSRQQQPEMLEAVEKLKEQIEFWRKYNNVLTDEPITYEPVLFEELKDNKNINGYKKLIFVEQDNPKVSIIVPVYNQFGYTYNCLRSILEHSRGVRYEVIVADDCSTDQTKKLERIVSGITVLHNTTNLKFLLNCNQAAEKARGEYILFLNNDTQVQPNWLQPLVGLLERDENIGMVGSKLVYPDGRLQEAGGILWKDGSAWNYGHLMNPESPEYCYVKEADYISGAAIMIRASLWREIGGFDTLFAPAYYEDTDLAFEVRRHGYKVYLQPKSIVVHFEGISNGCDVNSGLKSYQLLNHEKFYHKWEDVLRKEHFENGENVYLAKDRGQNRKQILVVDHYVPNFDRDAGGRCTYMYIKLMLKLGMKVTFIGDNYAKPEPYTSELLQMGVEVIYGDFHYLHWQEWLKLNVQYFDYIYLQRPHISIKYMDLVKKYGKGKVFYFAHDLHFIRTHRVYELTGDEDALKQSKEWKKTEMELFSKADVGHVVGSYEQKIIQKEFPDKPIRNIPLYIYEEMPEGIEKDFSKRKDILFVGGFNHHPNEDAVLWFGEKVYPHIVKKYPDIKWHIVGSNAPDTIKNLKSDNVILEGFVSDEELEELYRKCRLVVVPLRYGAGVKGKIVEAAYYQIPVVTTSIGGEGLDASAGAFVMEDDAEKMVILLEKLYTDFERLREMSDAGQRFIQKYFTLDAAEEVLLKDLDLPEIQQK